MTSIKLGSNLIRDVKVSIRRGTGLDWNNKVNHLATALNLSSLLQDWIGGGDLEEEEEEEEENGLIYWHMPLNL